MHEGMLSGNLKGINHMKDLDTNGRKILRNGFLLFAWELDGSGSGQGLITAFSEHDEI
jgi:hypothetical protein